MGLYRHEKSPDVNADKMPLTLKTDLLYPQTLKKTVYKRTSIFGTTFSRQSFQKIPGASQHH